MICPKSECEDFTATWWEEMNTTWTPLKPNWMEQWDSQFTLWEDKHSKKTWWTKWSRWIKQLKKDMANNQWLIMPIWCPNGMQTKENGKKSLPPGGSWYFLLVLFIVTLCLIDWLRCFNCHVGLDILLNSSFRIWLLQPNHPKPRVHNSKAHMHATDTSGMDRTIYQQGYYLLINGIQNWMILGTKFSRNCSLNIEAKQRNMETYKLRTSNPLSVNAL